MFPNQNYNGFNLSVFSGTSYPLIFPFAHGQILNKGTTEEETHCASYYSAHAARYQPDPTPWYLHMASCDGTGPAMPTVVTTEPGEEACEPRCPETHALLQLHENR